MGAVTGSSGSSSTSLISVADALAKILEKARPLPVENVPLAKAHGRAIARDLRARRDQPPFDASAMDGFAVNHEDAASPGSRLTLIGAASAGGAYRGSVKRGEAVRISTGAPLPSGTNSILIQENALVDRDQVEVRVAVRSGQHVRARGLDFAKNDTVIKAGKRLDARDLGVAASLNFPLLPVRRQPRVALFVTGNELVAPGKHPRADQIISSNNYALSAFIHHFGGVAQDLGIVEDKLGRIRSAIRKAESADILLTTGGASVGEHDLMRGALEAEGIRLVFWKIAMRPGKPVMFARRGHQRILGLPGNPVSALVCARVFVKPLIDTLLGLNAEDAVTTAFLGESLKANDQRQDYVRARCERTKDGTLLATPFPVQDSSMTKLLQYANCLIIRQPFAPVAAAGEQVDILPLDF